MNNKDLKKFQEEMRREATSSARMVGLVMITTVIGLVGIFVLASCSAPTTDAYEQHQLDLKEYNSITNYNGISHSTLNKMWDTLYIEAMINTEVK